MRSVFKLFQWNSHLLLPMVVHSVERPFACDECSKIFRSKSDLLVDKTVQKDHSNVTYIPRHLVKKTTLINTVGERQTLETSKTQRDYRFTKSGPIVEHMDFINTFNCSHINESNIIHQCRGCEVSFVTGFSLHDHMRVHSNEIYKCDLCGIVLEIKELLYQHTGNQTNEISYRLLSEPQNNREFSQPDLKCGFKKLKCKVCSKLFRWESHLTLPMVVHCVERPFVCDECSKT